VDITLIGWIALVVVILAVVAITPFAIREFILWRREVEEKIERDKVEEAQARAAAAADAIRERALRQIGVDLLREPVAVVKTTRKGRSRLDKDAVAAAAVLREVDG
jgi:hypothetical protein